MENEEKIEASNTYYDDAKMFFEKEKYIEAYALLSSHLDDEDSRILFKKCGDALEKLCKEKLNEAEKLIEENKAYSSYFDRVHRDENFKNILSELAGVLPYKDMKEEIDLLRKKYKKTDYFHVRKMKKIITGVSVFAGIAAALALFLVTFNHKIPRSYFNKETDTFVIRGSYKKKLNVQKSYHYKTIENLKIYDASAEEIKIPEGVRNIEIHFCENLTSIQFPSTAEYIEIQFCEELEEITLPEHLKGVDVEYSGLTSVTLPDSLTETNDYRFSDCASLSHVSIPNKMTSVPENAFEGCTSLTYILLPESITDIGAHAFASSGLEVFTMPYDVSVIRYGTFSNCKSLKEICDVNVSYQVIQSSAFEGCTSLEKISFPYSLDTIGYRAFEGCTSLTSIHIPANVRYIDAKVFSGCTNLSSIVVDSENPVYTSSDNSNVLMEYKTGKLIGACGNPVIPDGCKVIAEEALEGMSFEEIIIPDSVVEIQAEAFENCTNLKSIVIPESVTCLGSSCFNGCTSLESVQLPSNLTEIPASAFYCCKSLSVINLPDALTVIGASAFSGCASLTSVIIPSGVTETGIASFRFCTNLSSVILSEGVETISWYSFEGTGITSIDLPGTVTSIEESAFCNTKLKELYIPASLTSIENDAFDYCSQLEYITVDPLNKVYTSGNNCNAIIYSETLLKGCKNTVIPNDIKSISDGAFCGIVNLDITLPSSLIRIGSYAFANTTGIEDLKIPATSLAIGEAAFRCSDIKNVTIPSGTTEISDSEFEGSLLESITIPKSVTSGVFKGLYDCWELKEVHYEGTMEEWNMICGELENATIYCSDGEIKPKE